MPESALPDILVALDGAAPSAGPSFLEQMLPIAALVAIFYFLVIRPQMQKDKEKAAMVAALQRDDQVVTSSGLHGKVVEVIGETVVLDVGNKVRLTFDKSAVASKASAEKKE